MEILFLESLLILNNEYYSIQDSIIDKEKLCFKMLHSPLCGSLKILDYAKHYVKNKAFLDLSNYDKIMYLFQKVIDELLEKYRYDLLKKLVEREKENYQKQDSFAFLNHSGVKRILRTFKDAPSKVKKEYESLKIKKVINITILYLNAIDPTLKLQNIFLEALKNQSICLWDIYGSIVPSKILQYLAINEVFCWKTVSQETVFLNGPCEGNILDVYSLIHEFFHYVTFWAEENTKMSSCESFFTEVASIFHEKKLREFLKMIQYPSKDIDAISIFRKEGNNNCLPLLNSLYQLMELNNFNEEHLKQLKLFKYKEFYHLKNVKDGIDFLIVNLVTNNGNFYTSYRYFIASYIVKNLIEKINNGQTYLLNKINNLAFLLGKTTIEPLYIIDFLECHELFYDFVFPKKHPILRRTKNMSEKSEFLDF